MTELKSTQPQKKFKILLVGDVCIDEYIYGTIDRISPEAPVPVFVPKKTSTRHGMAHNVYDNLIALGAEVTFKSGGLSKKTRYVEEKSGYQILRIDQDVKDYYPYRLDTNDSYDAIVISDYNKGFVDYNSVFNLRRTYTCPIFIDSKKKLLSKFEGCFVKINELEYNAAETHCTDMIVTLGPNGSRYKDKFYPTDKVNVHDVTGAGDVYLAALCMFYLKTHSIDHAIMCANKLASISVKYEKSYVIQESDLKNL